MKSLTKTVLFLLTILLTSVSSFAQPEILNQDTMRLSLSAAVDLAVKQNQQLQSVQMDEEINQFKIKEIKSGALPQITGDANYNDNFSRASQILPGEVFGQPGTSIAVKFGTRYQFGTGLQLKQTIFSPSINTGLKAAKESQGYYALNTFKTKEDLIYEVVNVYMQLEMTEKQKELIVGNIERMKKLVQITDAQFKEGIIKKVDVDQLRVNYTNLRTQLSTTNNTHTIIKWFKTFDECRCIYTGCYYE
ncbi:MAG: TolC family protein [Chitinophagaceae bacterium]|nr:TolC family protein [Chitinophagaceae bacterium]